jgi:hypothetical protein
MNDCRLVGQDAILPWQVENLPHDSHWAAGGWHLQSGLKVDLALVDA